jgi:glycosyltransferase involved in cell wall biosynthesis
MSTFAVIVPVHNGEEFVDGCIRSILNQTRTPEEIIIVDDGSTDDTSKIINQWSRSHHLIRSISISKQGVSAARNYGASLAKSDFLLFLDIDDRWFPEKIASHEVHILNHPDCGFSFSLSEIINYGSKEKIKIDKSQTKKPTLFNVLMHEFQILGSSSSVCLNRKLFDSSKGFNPQLTRGEDWELWVRCSQMSPPCEIDRVLVSISLRQNSVEQSKLAGIDNFYSTRLHLRIWNQYLSVVANDEFFNLAIRILFADIWKNRFRLLTNQKAYNNLFNQEVKELMPLLKINGKKLIILKLLSAYLSNRKNND